MPGERVVVALGGNALARAGGDGSWEEAVAEMRRVVPALAEVVARGHELVVTHGNGPQVGMLLRQNELGHREVPSRPLDVLGAETQGQIGYLIEQELLPALHRAKAPRDVVGFLSRMVVSPRDRAFRHPTKPIGQYYPDSEARLLRKSRGWTLGFDTARGGWRRLVPSPAPIRWVEADTFRAWLGAGLVRSCVPVVAGGGGIPVLDRGAGRYEGVEAVIDKDLGAAVVARAIDATTLAIVTDVPAVAVGFRKPWETWLGELSARQLRAYVQRREFGEGTMEPKIRAALSFLAAGGRRAIITDAASLGRALAGEAGTRIHR